LSKTRLVMLASMGLHLDTEAWNRAGVDAALVKPVRLLRLHECLVGLLGPPPTGNTEWMPAHRLAAGALAGSMGLKHVRVLVAEDNMVNQKIALRQLKKLGFTADAVANGAEAVEAVRRFPYHIVLMDCQMPELDGYEATRQIRLFEASRPGPARPSIHIIAMTANAMGGDRERCLAAGMNDYLGKPVKLVELQTVLQRGGDRLGVSPVAPQPEAGGGGAANEDEARLDAKVFEGLRALREPGEPDPLAELIDLYLADAPGRIAALAAAVEKLDLESLRTAAHSLKGSSSNLGARKLARLASRLEQAVRTGGLEGAQGLVAQIREEYEAVRNLLEGERAR
jgi:CheY-like chemotaxis protein